jgi:NAD-dependent dihydropyrimidine dehydrogenase PreA subunit
MTSTCEGEPGSVRPVVSLSRCEGKGDCVRVCPERVFEVHRIDPADYRSLRFLNRLKIRAHGMRVAYTPDASSCRSCGLCVSACPERAISLRRHDSV